MASNRSKIVLVLLTLVALVAIGIWATRYSGAGRSQARSGDEPRPSKAMTDGRSPAQADATSAEAQKFASHARSMKKIGLEAMKSLLDQLKSEADLGIMDEVGTTFLNDRSIPRKDKIGVFLNCVTNNLHSSSFAAQYARDALRFLRPFEVADKLVAAFSQATDRQTRMGILDILEASAVLEDPSVPPDAIRAFKTNVAMVQDYFRSLVSSDDPEIAGRALKAYVEVAPAVEALGVLDSSTKSWLEKYNTGTLAESDLPPSHMLQMWLDVGLANEQTQDTIIPKLPDLIGNFSRDQITNFENLLYDVTKDRDLTSTARTTLRDYLLASPPDAAPESRYAHWLEAVSAVSVANTGDAAARYEFAANWLRKESQPMNNASVVIYSSDQTLSFLSDTELDGMVARFNENASNASSKEASEFFKTAVDRLQEYKASKKSR